MKFASVLTFFVFVLNQSLLASFPSVVASGGGPLSHLTHQSELVVGLWAIGHATSQSRQTVLGFYEVDKTAFETFLNSDFPLAAQAEDERELSHAFVISPNRTHDLRWTSGNSNLPLEYRLFVGTNPNALTFLDQTRQTFYQLNNLDYLRRYYWRVSSADGFGRSTLSALFSFTLAPDSGALRCAPNPFRAGSESIAFSFTMPTDGSATFSVFHLPTLERVFETELSQLQVGPNAYRYDGKDNHGKVLFNGPYLARITLRGGFGDETQKVRFLVVK